MWPDKNLNHLIEWNIQTAENISTNDSNQVYNMSHGL